MGQNSVIDVKEVEEIEDILQTIKEILGEESSETLITGVS